MISLCVNLARVIGLRPTVACLQIVFEWLGLPKSTSVRRWLMRVGVAALEEPVEVAEDWIWMADHSNQIGPEKVLAIIGVRASQLPPPGVALTHADMRVLMVKPGVSWKREDVGEAYLELAERAGRPLAVIVDGAVELREGAEVLLTQRKETLILGDFKHFAARAVSSPVLTLLGFPLLRVKGWGECPDDTRNRSMAGLHRSAPHRSARQKGPACGLAERWRQNDGRQNDGKRMSESSSGFLSGLDRAGCPSPSG